MLILSSNFVVVLFDFIFMTDAFLYLSSDEFCLSSSLLLQREKFNFSKHFFTVLDMSLLLQSCVAGYFNFTLVVGFIFRLLFAAA